MAGHFFGMTAFGGGEGMEFAKRKLTILNHHAVGTEELNSVFQKHKVGDSIPTAKIGAVLTDLYQGRAPTQGEINALLAPDAADGRRDVTLSKLQKNMSRTQGKHIGVDKGTESVLPTYHSFSKFNDSMTRHRRKELEPEEEWHRPLTESQKIGWNMQRLTKNPYVSPPRRFHHKSSEIAQFNDCSTKHDRGRSVKSEIGLYGQRRLEQQNMEGKPVGQQMPSLGLSGSDTAWRKLSR